ncbi:MAG: HD domain-containing protein [Candidatus Omnitrophica bacterium]|nr:HD domain-containing protein [Candidatus Omnitrophota bacterium]
MLSILNVLKKYYEEKKKTAEGVSSNSEKERSDVTSIVQNLELPSLADCGATRESISIFTVVNRQSEEEKAQKAREFYFNLVNWLRKIYTTEFQANAQFKEECFSFIDEQLTYLNTAVEELIHQANSDYPVDETWLASHAAAVSVIALEIAKGLEYNRQKLMELAACVFFHDIGMLKILDIVQKQSQLSKEELAQIRQHPIMGTSLLGTMNLGLFSCIGEVILQEHERIDGSGYPQGLKQDTINEYAKILGLADIYEALTHNRPYRRRITPPKAINLILNNKHLFDAKVLKKLLERIGVFPAGSLVRLNTKEIGVVTKINHQLPLRPTVLVLFEEKGTRLSAPKELDLSKNFLLCIEECIEENVTVS